MPKNSAAIVADGSQRRASYQRARSHDTKRALVQAAMALWRTNGYAKTTVADICRAAGVSRALFYFYFPAKEDVLFEVGLLSTRAAQKTVRSLLQKDYEVDAVIAEALRSLERSMARNPRELIIETILEGYRHEHRILAGEPLDDTDADMFGELFAKAQQDGKLAAHVDVRHLSHLAGMHVSEGVRHWAVAVAAVHKQPVPVDFLNLMSNEITIVGSMGYPDEIFEVTKELIANWEEYAVIVSHTIPFDDVVQALKAASTPGAADKVVVTFN